MGAHRRIGMAAIILAATLSLAPQRPSPGEVVMVMSAISQDRARPGDRLQLAVILDIAEGYHINSHQPTEDFLIPTGVTIQAPETFQVGTAVYPRPERRSYPFAPNKQLSVYEKRAVIRFPLTVKPTTPPGEYTLKAKVRYQPCSEKVCYPPKTRELEIPLTVVSRTHPVKRIHPDIFGQAATSRSSKKR
ncbi:MAG TPA: protein-disulfide reductase DsbD N-terminal domain-containing protein [Blastocatellia bacterium]|nr:protein-disulfide reductase DsbD N-terminal domain-containing protein [Blastocatellia bacterium]